MPLATVASQLSGIPTLFVRKQAKTYGTCRLAEGGEIDGQRLVVIEDVVTSGGQVIDSCCALRERGAQILAVLCVIDREAGGRENLARGAGTAVGVQHDRAAGCARRTLIWYPQVVPAPSIITSLLAPKRGNPAISRASSKADEGTRTLDLLHGKQTL